MIPGVQIPVALCLNLAYLSQSPDIGLSSKLYKKENSIESKKKPLTKQKQLLDQIHTNETYRSIECPASASDRHRLEGNIRTDNSLLSHNRTRKLIKLKFLIGISSTYKNQTMDST